MGMSLLVGIDGISMESDPNPIDHAFNFVAELLDASLVLSSCVVLVVCDEKKPKLVLFLSVSGDIIYVVLNLRRSPFAAEANTMASCADM